MSTTPSNDAAGPFRHAALFYRGLDDLVAKVVPYVRAGVADGAPVMVALAPDPLSAVTDALGPDAGAVLLADMTQMGRNPARIIPDWLAFVDGAPAGTVPRGVGEPVWQGRRDEEVAECRLHESLIDVALAGRHWELLCPYDADALPADSLDGAMRTHRFLDGETARGAAYDEDLARSVFRAPLPAPPDSAQEFSFDAGDLGHLRRIVHRLVLEAGLAPDAGADMVLAAHELATNSIQHGGGWGRLVTWRHADALVVEIRDTGWIDDPMVGRYLTDGLSEDGRGVWLANRLCDLVQVRSTGDETMVRLFAWL